MTPEEQAAADAAAVATKTTADADVEQTPGYWKAEAKKVAEKLKAAKEEARAGADAVAELQRIKDKDLSESQRLAKEIETLKPRASRADALEAQVQAILDAETTSLTDAQKAAIVGETPEARLAHLRALQAAGMIQRAAAPPVGANMPGAGGAGTVTHSQVAAMSTAQRTALYADVQAGRRSIVPG